MLLFASMFGHLRCRRRRLDDVLTRRGLAHTFSLARYRLHRVLVNCIEKYASGAALDAGSGRSPYKSLLQQRCDRLTSVDVEDRAGQIDLVADIQDMPQIEDLSFDTVFCSQVLEHVPRPWNAMEEMARVLRPGGRLILSVPHLSLIHEAPHDYFRYTCYGLQSLCEDAGLVVERVERNGGLCCFLSHAASLALMCTVGGLPLMHWPAWFLNYVLLVRAVSGVDRLFGLASVYPCDYIVVARKLTPDAEGSLE